MSFYNTIYERQKIKATNGIYVDVNINRIIKS